MNQELENRHTPDTKEYVTNITQLHAIIHDTNFLYCFMFGLKERIKEKIDNITKHLNKIITTDKISGMNPPCKCMLLCESFDY